MNRYKRFHTRFVLLVLVMLAGAAACQRDGPEAETETKPAPTRNALRAAFDAYEQSRDDLAHDRFEALPESAANLASALRTAEQAAAVELRDRLGEAARTADSLAGAEDLDGARLVFSEISRLVLEIAGIVPEAREGWHVFTCPMVAGFNLWMQPSTELENPYMGQAMPACGTPSEWTAFEAAANDEEVAHYTCAMHPSVRQPKPGACPICSMDLTPVTRGEQRTGVIRIDEGRRQLIGVRTALVERRPVEAKIRVVGTVAYDETRLADVTLKYRGWIGSLHVNQSGQRVEKGETLFTLYSPELLVAQEEFLAALESQEAARPTGAPQRADYLVDAARKRLRLWDIQEWQIDEIAASREPLEQIPIVSPVSGHVVEKNVVAGAAVEPGVRLYRIAGLERVWVEAEVHENELALIELGQAAEVRLPQGEPVQGRVSFLYPYLENRTRTARVRIELDNRNLQLMANMYADVELSIDRGERLVVPVEAVVYAGPRRLVFVDLGEGRLKSQEIELGARAGEFHEVRSGLVEGDRVVTSGNFLIAAESRLKSAGEQW